MMIQNGMSKSVIFVAILVVIMVNKARKFLSLTHYCAKHSKTIAKPLNFPAKYITFFKINSVYGCLILFSIYYKVL